jgi:hypothetical protein
MYNLSPVGRIFGAEGVMSWQNIAKHVSTFEPEGSLWGDIKQQIGSSKTVQSKERSKKT